MKLAGLTRFLTPVTILGMLAVFALLLAVWGFVMRAMAPQSPVPVEPTAVIQVIPPATVTPLVVVTLPPTPTKKIELNTPVANSSIKVGDYVQIANTGGDGLRIRSGPGTDQPPLFLGMDAEVFKVKEGPIEANGYIWWNLAAPYDANRQGWAAANFLNVVAQQP